MQPDRTQCIECDGEMEQGFIPDATRTTIIQQRWFKGCFPPKRWFGVELNWKEGQLVETYRCKACGYLKSYAKPSSGPEAKLYDLSQEKP